MGGSTPGLVGGPLRSKSAAVPGVLTSSSVGLSALRGSGAPGASANAIMVPGRNKRSERGACHALRRWARYWYERVAVVTEVG